ncbi:MAG TPA: hypothetical protein VJZ76_05585 [Thermoanaerobaculia bacterium]|nr:hypothetical protein [Thermoanaerobaculia bacterium]
MNIRKHAIDRGLDFIYQTARKRANFDEYGFDYLGCFHCLASTSKDRALRKKALDMGRERAHQWRRRNAKVPRNADPDDIANLVSGSYSAHSLGVPDNQLKQDLRKAAAKFTAVDYFYFDPATEPPPSDVPNDCDCGASNPRGRKTCHHCKRRLTMMTRYAVWQDAVIRTYMGERYGVRLGAPYAEVIKWLPAMRPYPPYIDADDMQFYDATYAVTHVVYTLNSYSCYQLSPRWLPAEYSFLKQNLVRAIDMDDPETMGEFLDALKSFGLAEDHPLIRKGVDFLLATQNADGSWGDVDAEDIYQRYHPTWTAVDGLREYAWRGQRLCFPALAGRLNREPVLRRSAAAAPSGAGQSGPAPARRRRGSSPSP